MANDRAHGGLSKPSKMPGKAWGISAHECHTGSKLREIDGSVCSKCYALKGMYNFPNVTQAHVRRLRCLTKALTMEGYRLLFRKHMIEDLSNTNYFRWHDSGDLQSADHLRLICEIAERTPHCSHWVPTKEKSFVKQYLREGGTLPKNVVPRLSAPLIGKPVSIDPDLKKLGVRYCSVGTGHGYQCPARTQGNKCGDCRACWDRRVSNVDYTLH